MDTTGCRLKPIVVCQYGKECIKTDPNHFKEYHHEHLDEIIGQSTTVNDEKQYQLSDDITIPRDLVLKQIGIIKDLFPSQYFEKNTKSSVLDDKTEQPSTSNDTNYIFFEDNVEVQDHIKVIRPKGKMLEKLIASRPYNYFLTCVTSSPQTHDEPLSITFQEILDPSLGDLECSAQINFLVDSDWLFLQYHFAGQLDKPMLILYGMECTELDRIAKVNSQITVYKVEMKNRFGSHHSKIMLLGYKDGSMRVVISTANLYEDDWHNRTQGLWMSERLDAIPNGSNSAAGDSVTEFRKELLNYLLSYNLPVLNQWIQRIQNTNFASVNVFLLTSIPGKHPKNDFRNAYGHIRVAELLSKHSAPIDSTVPIVAQSSSLGNFGKWPAHWLVGQFARSFSHTPQPPRSRKTPNVCVIYPSFKNVAESHDGLDGGGCLPYSSKFHRKQRWLNAFLYQWRADCRYRSKAVPHIKSYCRWTNNKLFWFILTSANLSIAAWGFLNEGVLQITNYEAGVLFLPKFVTNTSYFSMDDADHSTPVFPSLYDIQLTKYSADDQPFLCDKIKRKKEEDVEEQKEEQ